MQAIPGFVHIALSAGGAGIGQSAGFQHDQASLTQSQIRAPNMHEPGSSSHWPPGAGSAAGQNCLPQSQPSARHLQFALFVGLQDMPTTGQLDCSGGKLVGHWLRSQHVHAFSTQSQTRVL